VRQERPFVIEAVVVLPEHLHTLWTMPEGDSDYSGRWRAIKARFSRALANHGSYNEVNIDGGSASITVTDTSGRVFIIWIVSIQPAGWFAAMPPSFVEISERFEAQVARLDSALDKQLQRALAVPVLPEREQKMVKRIYPATAPAEAS
jgi:hypothetical protein